jgi:hypothetical protein
MLYQYQSSEKELTPAELLLAKEAKNEEHLFQIFNIIDIRNPCPFFREDTVEPLPISACASFLLRLMVRSSVGY